MVNQISFIINLNKSAHCQSGSSAEHPVSGVVSEEMQTRQVAVLLKSAVALTRQTLTLV